MGCSRLLCCRSFSLKATHSPLCYETPGMTLTTAKPELSQNRGVELLPLKLRPARNLSSIITRPAVCQTPAYTRLFCTGLAGSSYNAGKLKSKRESRALAPWSAKLHIFSQTNHVFKSVCARVCVCVFLVKKTAKFLGRSKKCNCKAKIFISGTIKTERMIQNRRCREDSAPICPAELCIWTLTANVVFGQTH